MEEEQLAIPFDEKALKANVAKKVFTKLRKLTLAFFKRIFEIIVSIVGLILLVPLTIIVAIKKCNKQRFWTNILYTRKNRKKW